MGSKWDNPWLGVSSSFYGSCVGWTGSWNGTDGGSGFSEEYKNQLRQYREVQVEAVQGWIYWTRKGNLMILWFLYLSM